MVIKTFSQKMKLLVPIALMFFVIPITSLAVEEEKAYISLFSQDEIQFKEDLGPLFEQLFQIGLTVAAVLAVIFIAVGGFQYMTTDAVTGKTEGRGKVQNAIFGLLLALIIVIILNTINPELLKLEPTIESLKKKGDGGASIFKDLDNFFQGKGGESFTQQTQSQQLETAKKRLERSNSAVGKPVGTDGRLSTAERKSLERRIERLKKGIRDDVKSDDVFEPTNRGPTGEQEAQNKIDSVNTGGEFGGPSG